MRFFDLNPSGRILNRFSKDMGAVDELMPRIMLDGIQIILIMCGVLIVIIVVNPALLIAIFCTIILYGLILKLYLRPSQDFKRLEGICKLNSIVNIALTFNCQNTCQTGRSPVFSYLTSTINGLTTIRTRNIRQKLIDEFDDLQDVHSSVWQLAITSNAACGLWLDFVSSAFVASVTFSFISLFQSEYILIVRSCICDLFY